MAETAISQVVSRELAQAMARRHAALLRMDVDALSELLDSDLRYTHSNGVCEDKASYVAALRQGVYVYHAVDEDEVEAFDLGGGLWCAGRVRMHATVKGAERRMSNRFVAVWHRTPQGLRLAAYCATPISPAAVVAPPATPVAPGH